MIERAGMQYNYRQEIRNSPLPGDPQHGLMADAVAYLFEQAHIATVDDRK